MAGHRLRVLQPPVRPPAIELIGPEVRYYQKMIWLSGKIRSQQEAEHVIEALNALKPMLDDPEKIQQPTEAANQERDDV